MLIFVLCVTITLYFYNRKKIEYVNIYGWYDLLPKDIIKQFEKETGIKVIYDFFDANDILETKLLAGKSGYDVVTPSASPYLARGISMGLFHPLDLSQIPNVKYLNPEIIYKLRRADPQLQYALPYGFGTYGVIYNEDFINELLGEEKIESYALIFEPKIAKKLKKAGISMLEEWMDVFPAILSYLGLSSDSHDPKDLKLAYQHLIRVRPFVRRFNSSRFINDLMIKELAIAQSPNHEANRAIKGTEDTTIKLKFFIPASETTMWMDTFAIPTDAPHLKNAHKFINFMLRPDIAAQITNLTLLPNAVTGNKKLIDPEILNNKTLFLTNIKNFNINLKASPETNRLMTKLWAKIHLGGN